MAISLFSMRCAGLIVFPVHGEYYNDSLLRIVLDGYPVVLVDRYLKGIAVNSVGHRQPRGCPQITSCWSSAGNAGSGLLCRCRLSERRASRIGVADSARHCGRQTCRTIGRIS